MSLIYFFCVGKDKLIFTISLSLCNLTKLSVSHDYTDSNAELERKWKHAIAS